jgi:aspartate racemase
VLSIGLVGGMSWESSMEYYKLLNLGVEQRLGGLHSARVVMASVEFQELTELQRAPTCC